MVTNQPLFPQFRGATAKAHITQFICSGGRPPLTPGWPPSLQSMLSLCWNMDPKKRPTIDAIRRDFQVVLVDVICPDKVGRKVARALWLGRETRHVPYSEFESVFTHVTHVDLTTASFCYRRCLSSMLCDPFDNTITFERFCNLLHYFDSLSPIDAFLNRLVTIFDQPWFFGFVPVDDAKAMLVEQWRQTKRGYYLVRLSGKQPGSFSLFAIDSNGLCTHWRIGHQYMSECFITIDGQQRAFKDLISLHAHCAQLPSMLLGKSVLPGSVCQSFFAANPLAASAEQ